MADTLSYYEAVATESAAMLAAARRRDWDAMIAAEKRCAAMIDRLKAAGEVKLDAQAQQRKAEIIRTVLAHDAEIRRLVDPRIRELEKLLSANAKRRLVHQAYQR